MWRKNMRLIWVTASTLIALGGCADKKNASPGGTESPAVATENEMAQGAESSSGQPIKKATVPTEPFQYDCQVEFYGENKQGAFVSQAKVSFHNKRIAYNLPEIKTWKHFLTDRTDNRGGLNPVGFTPFDFAGAGIGLVFHGTTSETLPPQTTYEVELQAYVTLIPAKDAPVNYTASGETLGYFAKGEKLQTAAKIRSTISFQRLNVYVKCTRTK